jgi:hypothetical protein
MSGAGRTSFRTTGRPTSAECVAVASALLISGRARHFGHVDGVARGWAPGEMLVRPLRRAAH